MATTTTNKADNVAQLQEALEQAKGVIQKQNELLQQLTATPNTFGVVHSLAQDYVKVVSGTGALQVLMPEKIKVNIGDEVTLAASGQILAKSQHAASGLLSVVTKVFDDHGVEIETQGASHLVAKNPSIKLEEGDEVLVDVARTTVLKVITRHSTTRLQAENEVDWADIGGLEHAKLQLQEAIEWPILHKNIFANYNKRPIKGIELYGNPGCGKTMLGKAIATTLKKRYGLADTGFFYMKGPELLSPYVGMAEAKIRAWFASGRRYKAEHGIPAVGFIDEADAILPKRGSGISSDIEKTIVPTFLSELDGMDNFAMTVILATNREGLLDPAIVRPGRIDRKIKIGRPDKETSKYILKIYLKKTLLKDGIDELVEHASDAIFDNQRIIYKVETVNGSFDFLFSHLISGAVLANMVDLAVSAALYEDIANKKCKGSGIMKKHIEYAVKHSIDNVNAENHDDDIKEFTKGLPKVVSIKKVKIAA